MGKIRPGNKLNSFLNFEWAKHGGKFGKHLAAIKRRMIDKKVIKEEVSETPYGDNRFFDDDNPRYNVTSRLRNAYYYCRHCNGDGIIVDDKGSTATTDICLKCFPGGAEELNEAHRKYDEFNRKIPNNIPFREWNFIIKHGSENDNNW